ncbi:MAG: carboxypeptidase regulatory-like domain-containing protein [Terriglobales bacterium]
MGQSRCGVSGRVLVLLALAMSLVGIAPLVAQTATSSGTVSGRVTDKTGALIVGAQITLTNVQTGLKRQAPSNQSGLFNFALVKPGTYLVSTTKAGFATMNTAPTALAVGQTITFNFAMTPGSQTQTVEVTSVAPLLNTNETGVASNITPAQVQDLPLNGNDYGSLAVLVPGIKSVNPYDPTKSRVATFSVDGSSGRNVNVSVDGVENKDNSVGGPDMQLALNAVQEFKVSPNRFSAANGRSEGAAINVVQKSGTNQFHGGAQYYFTDTALNAIDYFSETANGGSGNKPQFDRQQYGVDVGGPVIKNQDFFFLAYYRDNETTAIPVTSQAYTEMVVAQKAGLPVDPVQSIPTPYNDNRWSTRFDHTINSANNLSLTFNWQSNYGLNDQDGNTDDGTQTNFTKNNMILGGLTWNTVISPTTVNSLTGGYQYWNNLIDTNQITPYSISFPSFSAGVNGNVPQNTTEKKWEIRDDFSTNHGNHDLKFGEDYVWDPMLAGFFEFNEVPAISFSDDPSVIAADGTGGSGFTYTNGFATPGAVTSMSTTAGDPFYAATGGTGSLGLYAEDDWRATSRLTVNLGVRYERDTNTYGENDMAQNRVYLMLKQINSPWAGIPKTQNGDLAPIFGFTYDLTGHGTQLLRGGFGMYYGQTFQNIPLFALQQADPTMFNTVYSASLTQAGGTCTSTPCNVPGTAIPLSSWEYGVDPAPAPGVGQTQLQNGTNGRYIDPSYGNPVSEQFNLGYTWQFDPSDAIFVDYVHELGLHESRYINIDPVVNGTQILTPAFTAAGLPDLNEIQTAQSIGRSRYDSLSVEWRRRMSSHFSIDTNYDLSRSLAWDGAVASFGASPITSNPWDPINFGYSGNDQRHHVSFSGIFDLPWGINVAPILQAGSAQPYNTSMGRSIFGLGPGFGDPHIIVPNNDPTDYAAYESASASSIVACLAAATCSQLPMYALRGQPDFDLDARFGKSVKTSESTSLNLFFQAFDLTNRTNFGNSFSGTVTSHTFMTPTAYSSPSGVVIPKSFRGEFGAEFVF